MDGRELHGRISVVQVKIAMASLIAFLTEVRLPWGGGPGGWTGIELSGTAQLDDGGLRASGSGSDKGEQSSVRWMALRSRMSVSTEFRSVGETKFLAFCVLEEFADR